MTTDNSSYPTTHEDGNKELGVIQLLLHDMPAWQKSILSFFLIVPIALALSGLILQINVGAIIQALINEQLAQNREQTVGRIRDSLQESTATITEQSAAMQREAAIASGRLDRLEERTNDHLSIAAARIEKLELRTEDIGNSVNDIKVYICDNDGKERGNCALLK